MKKLRVLNAPFLQVRVRFHVLCDKRRRGNAKHVERKFLLIHQLRPGHTHEFDANAHEAHIVDVGRNVRTRPGKTHPAAERLWFGINAVSKLRRKIVVNDELASHNPLCFGVATTLKPAWFPESAHLGGKARDD